MLSDGVRRAAGSPSLSIPQGLRGGGHKAYLGALATAQAAAFMRSVVLARLLGPEQMGLAAIIILSAQFFDQVTDTANDKFLVQDRFGDRPDSLQLIHLVAIAKGILVALFLILLAEPIARFTAAPATAGALAVLAIVPFLNGFTNYDFRIAQRHHKFRPEAIIMVASEMCGLVATVIAAFIVRDFTAVLYGLAVRALAGVIASQWVASNPYRPGYSSERARALWRFGAPLLVNGLLIFVSTQSDRVIISRSLGMADLGRYTVILLLGWYPSITLMRFIAAIFLPLIAGARDAPSEMRRNSDRLDSCTVLLAVYIGVGFAFVVPSLLPIIFGSKFASTTMLVTLLGQVVLWRTLKIGPATAAVATAHTRIVTINNVLRLSGIAAAVAAYRYVGGLRGIAAGLILGEVIANTAASILLCRAMNWPWANAVRRYTFAGVAGLLLVAHAYAADNHSLLVSLGAATACLLLLAVCSWYERDTLKQLTLAMRQAFKI